MHLVVFHYQGISCEAFAHSVAVVRNLVLGEAELFICAENELHISDQSILNTQLESREVLGEVSTDVWLFFSFFFAVKLGHHCS